MIYLCIAFAVIVPYLICSINPAIVVSRMKGKDIREMGSGNPGLTNTFRTMGKRAAAIVLLFDTFKGVISLAFISILIKFIECPLPLVNLLWIGSMAGVLGHCYPVYYKFKGGKAALVTFSTGLIIDWRVAMIALAVFVLVILVTRYVSLGSLIAVTAYAVCSIMLTSASPKAEIAPFPIAIAVLLIFKHKGNIQKLIKGEENKFGNS